MNCKVFCLGLVFILSALVALNVGYVRAQTQSPGQITKFDHHLNVVDSVITEDASANIGIGTGSPVEKLTVQTPSGNYGVVHTDGTVVVGSWVGAGSRGELLGAIGTKSHHPLVFFAADSLARMTIDTAGNIGIGTTTPREKLDVTGNQTINGNLTASGPVSASQYNIGGLRVVGIQGINLFLGVNAGANNTTGQFNMASGYAALGDNTTGSYNTASGVQALLSNTTGNQNTANGVFALRHNTTGSYNTASGVDALRSNTTGSQNTASGAIALQFNTTGSQNTASGVLALRENTTGSQNTASGVDALRYNTTGSQNTASGVFALRDNTTGGSNTASGFQALLHNTMGENNTASGVGALVDNTIGGNNTASGANALGSNTSGSANTAIGLNALQNNASGNNNTAIGNGAGTNQTTGSRNIYVDNPGVAGESNTIRIGNANHERAFIAGINGVNIESGAPVFVNDAGQLGTISSSRRFKEAIGDMGEASRGLLQLRPVTFRYKKAASQGGGVLEYGLIAEEVAAVYPELVVYSATGEAETVQYHKLNAMLLNEVQKQHRQLKQQKQAIGELQTLCAENTDLIGRIESLERLVKGLQAAGQTK